MSYSKIQGVWVCVGEGGFVASASPGFMLGLADYALPSHVTMKLTGYFLGKKHT